MTDLPLGLYVHWPYCAKICPYCDFNVVRDRGGDTSALAEAIISDMTAQAELTGPRDLASVFFGGGTPSLMDPAMVARVLATARSLWRGAEDLEVTLEANPTDAESARFAAFAAAGVNRLSLGVQSLDDPSLKVLGRNHDAATALAAIDRAQALFPRLSIDLIYALPGQSPEAWAGQLARVVGLGPEHVSPYQLTIEPGTAFDRAVRRGVLKPPGGDLAADLYETTQAVLLAAGYDAYEVSNHARGQNAQSRHNLIYWRGHDYVGVGPGAHGRISVAGARYATTTARQIKAYIARESFVSERLDPREAATERLLMGLRTTEGVTWSDLAALDISQATLESLAGLLVTKGGRLFATAQGRCVLDTVVAKLADSP